MEAQEQYWKIMADPETRRIAELREKAIRDEVTNLNVNPKEKNKTTLLYINIFSAVFGVCLWMAPVISFLINIFSIVMSAINIKLNKEKFLPIALLIVSIVFCVASIVGTYI